MPIKIKAKKDLYSEGKCFTKDKIYTLNNHVNIEAEHELMNKQVINDQGHKHLIGLWYKNFQIVK